jgi:hypothetical protein
MRRFAYRSEVGATRASPVRRFGSAGSAAQSGNPSHPVCGFILHKRRRNPLFTASGVHVKVRFVFASAAAALGFACSSSSFARVMVAYAPVTVVYFPPRPACYYAPPPAYIIYVDRDPARARPHEAVLGVAGSVCKDQ